MTSERTQAYGRVVKTLEDLGPAKLQPAEQDRVRDAADQLVGGGACEPSHTRRRRLLAGGLGLGGSRVVGLRGAGLFGHG